MICNRSSPSISSSPVQFSGPSYSGKGREGTKRYLNTCARVSSSTINVCAGDGVPWEEVEERVHDGRSVTRAELINRILEKTVKETNGQISTSITIWAMTRIFKNCSAPYRLRVRSAVSQ